MSQSSADEWAVDDDEDVPLGQEASSAVGSLARERKKKDKKDEKQTAKEKNTKAKAKAKAKKVPALCFAAQCPNPKAGKSRFCSHHRPMYNCMEYQATKSRTVPVLQRMFADAESAAQAFKQFEKDTRFPR